MENRPSIRHITRWGWGVAGVRFDGLGGTGRWQKEDGDVMSDLIAIGYPDEATAEAAAEEARGLARDLIIEPDAIAVIVRDKEGKYHVHTSHHLVGGGATWGMFWGLLFGVLFFVPVVGIAIGAGLGLSLIHISQVRLLDQRLYVQALHKTVHVDAVEQGIHVDALQDIVDVQPVDQRGDIYVLQNAIDVDPIEHGVQVDSLHERVQVQYVDGELDDALCNALGERF